MTRHRDVQHRRSLHLGSKGLLVLAGLLSLAFFLTLVGSAAGATKRVRVKVPLPAADRQNFAVITLKVRQKARPGKIKNVKAANASKLPDDIRTGVATTGPRKRRAGRWEYVMLVAINDLRVVATNDRSHATRARASQTPDSLELIVTAAARGAEYNINPCPEMFRTTLERFRRTVRWWHTTHFGTPDKSVAENAVREAQNANPNCQKP